MGHEENGPTRLCLILIQPYMIANKKRPRLRKESGSGFGRPVIS